MPETASSLDDLLLTPLERDTYPDREFFECLSRLVIASPSSQTANWRSVYASLWPAFCHSLLSCRGGYRPVRWHRAIVNIILSIEGCVPQQKTPFARPWP